MATKTWLGTTSTAWATTTNWAEGSAPGAGDDVRIVADAVRGIAGSDQSGTAIGDFIVEEGFTYGLGDATTALKLDPDRFEFFGSGSTASYLDLHSAAITACIKGTATATTGKRGLYIVGSGLTTVSIAAGSVGIASRHGKTATVATVMVVGSKADVWIGEGVTLTTLEVTAGKARLRCPATTVNVDGGELLTEEVGAITTMNVMKGSVTANSTGTITTANVYGGSLDFLQSGLARTVSTLKINPGGACYYDPGVMTLTAISEADYPIRISTTKG